MDVYVRFDAWLQAHDQCSIERAVAVRSVEINIQRPPEPAR